MTFPTVAVDTTDLDASGDSPASARADLLDLVQKVNQIIAHVSAFAATLLDDANAAAARTTLGALGAADNIATATAAVTATHLAGGAAGRIPYQTGSGATAFVAVGSAGQVLYSNGTSAPAFAAAPSAGVSSVNGQTGAVVSTTLYAIGSSIIGRPGNGSGYIVNSTIAGSSLYSTAANERYSGSFAGGAVLVGTGSWRCVSPADGDGSDGFPGLWVRYA